MGVTQPGECQPEGGWGSAGGGGGQPGEWGSVRGGQLGWGGQPGGGGQSRGTQLGQQNEYSLHGGRYASCVHAGGLSCYISSF